MAHTASLVYLISTVSGCSKKEGKKVLDVLLVLGTLQTLSNLYFLISMIKNLGPYSQQLFFFVTYKWDQKVRVFAIEAFAE
jgi:hypothetical protein